MDDDGAVLGLEKELEPAGGGGAELGPGDGPADIEEAGLGLVEELEPAEPGHELELELEPAVPRPELEPECGDDLGPLTREILPPLSRASHISPSSSFTSFSMAPASMSITLNKS